MNAPKLSETKKRKLWVAGETAIVALFVMVAGLAALDEVGFISLEKWAQVWVGRILLAFTALIFIYITHKAQLTRTVK